jgi:hypothetical protein
MNSRTRQWRLLLSSVLTAAVLAAPWLLHPVMFLLLTFLYGVVVRFLWSLVVVLSSLFQKPVPSMPWAAPIPIAVVIVLCMLSSVGVRHTMGLLARLSLPITDGLGKLFTPLPFIIALATLIALGTLEDRALNSR